MQYGIYCPNFGPFADPRGLSELAAQAEAAGWDGLFLWDHIARAIDVPVGDPWILLSAAAMTTTRIRLGPLVTPIARRRPWKLARETASLDRLSGGRLVFGAGLGSAGGSQVEWAQFGEETDARTRAAMLDEGLEVLTGLWSGEPFHFAGEHYRVDAAQFRPTPLQQPRIPVWIAGYWPNRRPMQRAARWDGVFPLFRPSGSSGEDLEALRECVDFVHQERGSDDLEIVHLAAPTPGRDPARAAERVAPFRDAGVTWWLERLTPDEFGGHWKGDWHYESMRERVAQGPPRLEALP